MIDQFLEGNKVFIEKDYKQNRDHYLSLSRSQSPKTLWIECADSRVAPERITNANAGDIFLHRNIAHVVPVHDWNFASVLEYAVTHLKVHTIVICGNSECGGIKAFDKDMPDSYIPLRLNNVIEAKTRVHARLSPQKRRSRG